MQVRLTLLILIVLSSCDLFAQGQTNTIVLVEKIAYKAKYSLASKLCNVLVDSIPFRQNVISREFSIKPHSYYQVDNRRYALWNVGPEIDELDIEVVTEIELLDFDLNTIKKSQKRDSLIFERSKYLEKDKFLQIDYKRLVETANRLKKENEFETIQSVFNFVIDKLEYKRFPNQERGAKRALKTGLGDCTEYTELLIALCRTLGIPARSPKMKFCKVEKYVFYCICLYIAS